MPDRSGELEAIRRRRGTGAGFEREEILERFRLLEGASFDEDGVLEAFSDVFDAVCAPEHITFQPDRGRCKLDAGRREIRFGGLLYSAAGDPIGKIERAIDFQIGVAHHHLIVINPQFRDVGIAALILAHSLDFYAEVGIKSVVLTAGLTARVHYWAKLGFDFDGSDAEATRHWIARVNAKLGLGLDCTHPRAAQDWLRCGREEGTTLTLEEIAQVFDAEKREQLETRAQDGGFGMDEPIPLGKALLLSVGSWQGRLSVGKAARTQIKAYVAAKADGAAMRLRCPIDSPKDDD